MTLQGRIVGTLAALAILLVTPAVYGVVALRGVGEIAHELQTRHAAASLAVGRLQMELGEVDRWHRSYLALATVAETDRADVGQRMEGAYQAGVSQLEQLQEAGFVEAARRTEEDWTRLGTALTNFRRLVEEGRVTTAEAQSVGAVRPLVREISASLEPLGAAVDTEAHDRVVRARTMATGAATTTLLTLAIALLIALVIGVWLTGTLLRPIHHLQRGMAEVSQGNFEPDVTLPTDRSDELGDLARSFSTMTAQLSELERMKAEFLSVGSHELKTPLSVIQGYVTLLIEGVYGSVPDKHREPLRGILSQTERLTQMVQQLLDISRFEAGGMRIELRPLALEAFVKDLAAGFKPLATQNEIHYDVEIAADLPGEINADAERMNEVLGNLLSNAFKFTGRGGTVRFAAEKRSPDEIGFVVEDTGVGIPADHLERVFDKFYQVENTEKMSMGSGLGLAIAKELVEAHGGTISAESVEGEGTRFTVILPIEPPLPDQ